MASTTFFSFLTVGVLCGTAFAERSEPPKPVRIRVPGAAVQNTSGNSAVSSRIVFMHRCIGGCVIRQGTDDSRTDTSSIVGADQILLGSFNQDDQVWADAVKCVRETFAPFNITVTDQDPGNTTPHFEAMVGGKASDLQRSDLQNAGGVSPWDCGEIPNAITYTFDVYGPDPLSLCWTVSQEVAHGFGLDHSFVQKDPMTYHPGDLPKRFRDEEAECGEFQVRSCCANAPKQNSYRRILALFGPGAPTPPTIALKNPTDGRVAQPGFTVAVDAQDDVRVERVEVRLDGTLVGMATLYNGLYWELKTPKDTAQGPHTLEVKAVDVQGVAATAMSSVDVGPACTPTAGCIDDDVCVDGVCVPGPAVSGGLGSICQADTECLSHRCTDTNDSFKRCTESCDPSNSATCPSEFECRSNGADGVCWPTPDAGCCDAGTSPQGSILLGLGVGALVIRRRRRR